MKSVVSYPERGAGGNNLYRGNCSPELVKDLIKQYRVNAVSDYMCGSGTTRDAANSMKIKSACYDLNTGFNMLEHEIPERPEFIFWHPPYWDIIVYSDVMYKASAIQETHGFDPKKYDLSRIPAWDDFVKAMNLCMLKQFSALEKGGRMAVLVGDIKKKGRLYSMIFELAKPGTLEQCIIKMQHNCFSDKNTYSNANFVPIAHEYVLVLKKDSPLVFNIQYAKNEKFDMRDLPVTAATWRDVVASVFEERGKKLKLDELYEAIEGHRKAASNPHWKEKVRQTLQLHKKCFLHVDSGVWALAS